MENNTEKLCLKNTNKKRKNALDKANMSIQQFIEKNKRNQRAMMTNFIKDKVESFSDTEVYTHDDDDSEEDRVIEFS